MSGHRRVVPLTKLIEADAPPRNLGFSRATVADEWPQGRKALKTFDVAIVYGSAMDETREIEGPIGLSKRIATVVMETHHHAGILTTPPA